MRSAGEIFAPSPPTNDSFAPPVKNSGAPHSSRSMCASACVRTVPQGGQSVASASAFAAVPDETVNTRTFASKNLPKTSSSESDQRSAPYARATPVLLAEIASRISRLTAAVLSDLK
jgi:hypothetical protein